MSATIRDIKAATGLSLATISKFLNGGNVLPENRVKLEAAIKELHYEVNELARGLVTNRTRTIGVVVYAVENTFTGTLLKYVGESLRRRGYGMLICDSGNDEEVEARNIKFLINKKVDGIIVIPVSGRANFLEPAKNAGIPVVLMDRNINGEFDCIKTNNRTASKRAVEVLIDAGHTAIACIGSESEYTGKERLLGYKDAMEAAGLAIRPEYIKRGTHSIEFGSTAMQELLELPEPPTAVFMTNYEINLGSVITLHRLGISCPEEISLIGFDDLILSHIIEPKISVMAQPMKEMGERAAETLLKHIEDSDGEAAPEEMILSAKYIEGESIRKI
ncbi:MAG: LacI family DNA-binding transcriptional regulator [Lachnospiraceae bacterium]|nr:LacI family DNA-binding transcriptional regulator [Lachnospiraceae bacterium]